MLALIGYWCARKYELLTTFGVITALVGGGLVYSSFNWKGILLISLFFLSSSFWSRFESRSLIKERDTRTSFQVLANGGGAFIAAIGYMIYPNVSWIAFFIASLAGANADTWASEIGVLSKEKPFHIFKLQKVESGMSGAITKIGTIASFFGSLLISLSGVLLFSQEIRNLLLSLFILTALGFIGSLIDTVIGATIEVTYECERCKKIVESRLHCGQTTVRRKGLAFLGNNWVNFISNFASGLLGGIYFWG
jgi:uncharacterized protein (TIGR00297 family)